jgi:hypothetical protein
MLQYLGLGIGSLMGTGRGWGAGQDGHLSGFKNQNFYRSKCIRDYCHRIFNTVNVAICVSIHIEDFLGDL